MIIAQISDTHLSLAHRDRTDNFAACIDHLNQQADQPDLVIHTGDLVHEASAQDYAAAAQILRELKAPLYVIPGNRDNRARMIDAMADLVPLSLPTPFLQYAIGGYPIRVICLDSLSLDSNKGQLCADRLGQLRAMLQSDQQTPTAVFMHHPPFEVTQSRDPFQFENKSTALDLLKLLHDATNVTGLFCGHVHRPSHRYIGAMSATTMTSIALDLRVGHNPPKTDLRPRYDLHQFDADGAVQTRSVIVERDHDYV